MSNQILREAMVDWTTWAVASPFIAVVAWMLLGGKGGIGGKWGRIRKMLELAPDEELRDAMENHHDPDVRKIAEIELHRRTKTRR